MGEEEYLNEIHNLEKKVNEMQNDLMNVLEKEKDVDQELEELKAMAIWSKIVNNNFEVKISQMMVEGREILPTETIQEARQLVTALEETNNVVVACQAHEERRQKRTKWLNQHMMSMDNLTEHGSCACAPFKECPTNEKKLKKLRDLIDELGKIGGICLTIGAMQMWDNSEGQQNSTHFIQSMIPLIIGGLVLLALRCLLILQPNEPSIKLKRLERISRFLLIVVCIGLIMISYISLLKGKPLADLQ